MLKMNTKNGNELNVHDQLCTGGDTTRPPDQ